MSPRPQDTPARAYAATRYYLLNECRRVRAMVRIGTASVTHTTKERRSLQSNMVQLRRTRA